ncbi:MAG TPA: hypothetical protein ENL46_03185, partial [Candidatus Aminicenantes bacterium]|nr:hypothetical protein [Candidatus Aminicenantes bacterium]
MEPFNIKKINFFKKNPSPPPKKKKNNHIPATLKKEIGFIKKIINSPYFYFVIFTISITILTTYIPSHSLPNFEEGEIASSNVVAPSDMTIEDTETTEKRKQEAADTVLPVYSLDENVSLNTEEKIRDLFNSGRDLMQKGPTSPRIESLRKEYADKYGIDISSSTAGSLIQEGFSTQVEEDLITLVRKYSKTGIITSKSLFSSNEQERGFT